MKISKTNPPDCGKISNSKGYTLVEMLAVIVVFSVIGGIIAAIFASSLRGSNKANVTNEVRQNGNYALTQISRMITYAKSFDGISVDGVNYDSECYIEPVLENTPTPTPSEYHYLKITGFDGGQITFVCLSDPDEISSNTASMINESTVSVDSCKFNCEQLNIIQPPTIKINFSLSQKNQEALFENKTSMSFETSATMRNLGK